MLPISRKRRISAVDDAASRWPRTYQWVKTTTSQNDSTSAVLYKYTSGAEDENFHDPCVRPVTSEDESPCTDGLSCTRAPSEYTDDSTSTDGSFQAGDHSQSGGSSCTSRSRDVRKYSVAKELPYIGDLNHRNTFAQRSRPAALITRPPLREDTKTLQLVNLPYDKFAWTKEHMQALLVIRAQNSGSWEDTASFFNRLFVADTCARGFPEGLPASTIRRQFNEHISARRPLWREVNTAFENGSDDFRRLTTAISRLMVTTQSSVVQSTPQPHSRRETCTAIAPRRSTGTTEARPIPPDKAHPPLPVLLFRCYHDNSHGENSSEGFVAGRFRNMNSPPPLSCDDPRMLQEVFVHLNKENTATPFISTTDSFVNAIQRGTRAAEDGAVCRISIINPFSLGQEGRVFHAAPYRDELVKDGIFDRRNGWYRPTNEYLVWGCIPKDTLLCDFSLAHLQAYLCTNHTLRSVLRLHLLNVRRYSRDLAKRLAAQPSYLTAPAITAIAEFLVFLGADLDTPPVFIARIVSEIVRGWAVKVDTRIASVWIEYATVFALSLASPAQLRSSALFEKHRRFRGVCAAFLSGVRTGLGERNWYLSLVKEKKMMSAVRGRGLVFPDAG